MSLYEQCTWSLLCDTCMNIAEYCNVYLICPNSGTKIVKAKDMKKTFRFYYFQIDSVRDGYITQIKLFK